MSLPIYCLGQADFMATFKTDNPGNSSNTSATIPCISALGYQVDFNNDGDLMDAGESTVHTTGFTHDFGTAGTYTIRIVGNLDRILFDNEASNDPQKILSIDQWGTVSVWTSMNDAFYGCTNISIPAADAPDLSSCGTLNRMFRNAANFNEPIDHWNVSNITQMTDLFRGASNFNQPFNSWDVSNVVWGDFIFAFTAFNQPLDAWNISGVSNMSTMFRDATSFDQPLDSWIVSGVSNMSSMFLGTSSFNQSLASWNVSGVMNMTSMFRNATNFNQPLDAWNISSVTNMANMLNSAGLDCINYDATLIGWEAQGVTGITLGADGLNYDDALAARNSLTTTYSWTISGDTYSVGCSVLPIELLSFEVNLKGHIVYLNWQTASEINNEGFEIEDSTDGDNWRNIGFVNGSGTSYELNNYQFLHQNPVSGINYYRLKQLDYDGFFEYSSKVSVERGADWQSAMTLFPNPVKNGTITLSFPDDDFEFGELLIYDSVGRLVHSQAILNTNTEIQTSHFRKGIYLMRLEMDRQRFLKRIVVQ